MKSVSKPILYGFLAFLILLAIYFSALTLVSGWDFAQSQFSKFWYFILSLALGFGVQVGLYTYLKSSIQNQSRKVLVASGTTSTVAMISCCSHYLVNILPIIGVTGFITVISQYQVQLFWVGLVFNLFGIIYILNKVIRLKNT